MELDQLNSAQSDVVSHESDMSTQSSGMAMSRGGGYAEQAAALSPRQPLLDPETNQQVGTFLDYDGVVKVFDKKGKLVWIDELPIQSTVGPLDLLFGVRGLVAAAGAALKIGATEAHHRHTSEHGIPMQNRVPDYIWAELRETAAQ